MLRNTLNAIAQSGGFIRKEQLAALTTEDRLRQVLVRCGGSRFICAAQDCERLIQLVEATGEEYVRDVSLPAGDPAHCGDTSSYTDAFHASFRRPAPRFSETDCGGVFDGVNTVLSDADPGL